MADQPSDALPFPGGMVILVGAPHEPPEVDPEDYPPLHFLGCSSPAPSHLDTTRMIEIYPPDNPGFEFELLGFLSQNRPEEIHIRAMSVGDTAWKSVDPHLFAHESNYPFFPAKERGIVISKKSPLCVEFSEGLTTPRNAPVSLHLVVVGVMKRVASSTSGSGSVSE